MSQLVTAVAKLELRLTEEDKEILDGQSRICNWLYNHLLEQANALREAYRKDQCPNVGLTLYSKRGLRNLVPRLKEDHPFLKVVHSSPSKNTALRLADAIQSHQQSRKGRRKGKRGWPRFRSWQRSWFSLLYDEPEKGFKIQKSQLLLSLGMGQDRKRRALRLSLVGAEALKGKTIRNLRIVKQSGRYYAVFTVDKELPAHKPISKIVALDPNHKNFAYGVNNSGEAFEIAAPRWLRKIDVRIDELKRRKDRCKRRSQRMEILDKEGQSTGKSYWKPSKQWQRYAQALERAYQKRQDQTKAFLYTLAHHLCRTHDCIGVGNYTPHGGGENRSMRRAMNNRSLIGRFKEVLHWVAQKSGKLFIEFDEQGTTRTCSSCGHRLSKGLSPSIREWICPSCNCQHLRDENAAQNGMLSILRELKEKYQVPGSGLAPILERWAWRVLPSGVMSNLAGVEQRKKFAAPGNSIGGVVSSSQNLVIAQL